MDSGNSGSLQSSSGGEDEFDSRGGGGGGDSSSSISALLRPTPASLHASLLYGLSPEFTSALPQQQQLAAAPWFMASGSGTHHQQVDPPPPPPRGSRKRARASRRAPTTVLTTDTSNFRAMVQEFTGIPSPPFHSRFDHVFPSPSTLRPSAASSSMPPYILRPFAQKPFTSTPPSSNITGPNANANQRTVAGDDDLQLTSSGLLRMQDNDGYLSFQNLLGSTQPAMFSGFPQAAPRSPSQFMSGGGDGGELSGVVAAGVSSSSAAASTDRPPGGAP